MLDEVFSAISVPVGGPCIDTGLTDDMYRGVYMSVWVRPVVADRSRWWLVFALMWEPKHQGFVRCWTGWYFCLALNGAKGSTIRFSLIQNPTRTLRTITDWRAKWVPGSDLLHHLGPPFITLWSLNVFILGSCAGYLRTSSCHDPPLISMY